MMKLTKSSRALRRATAFVLAAALTLSAPVATSASAASKKVPSLSVKKKTLYFNKAGKKAFTLKVKKNKVKLVKTKWTTSKKSVAKLSGKKKTKVKVTAKKKGTAKITAKVTYKAGSKKKTKKLVCKVTSKKAKAPVKTETPVATSSSTAAPTDAPTQVPTEVPTQAPTEVPTAEPTATAEPTQTPAAVKAKVENITSIDATDFNLLLTFSNPAGEVTDDLLKGAKLEMKKGSITATATFDKIDATGAATFKIDDSGVLCPKDRSADGEYTVTTSSACIEFPEKATTTYEEALAGMSVEGYVTRWNNDNPADSKYVPVAGAVITIKGGKSAVTDSTGHYRIATTPGKKTMSVEASLATKADADYISQTTGTGAVSINRNHPTAQNFVLAKYNPEQVILKVKAVNKDNDTINVEGATVKVKNADGKTIYSETVKTDANGRADILNKSAVTTLAGGNYRKQNAWEGLLLERNKTYTVEVEKPLAKNQIHDVYKLATATVTIGGEHVNEIKIGLEKVKEIDSMIITQKYEDNTSEYANDQNIYFTYQLYTDLNNDKTADALTDAPVQLNGTVKDHSVKGEGFIDALKTAASASNKATLPTGTYYVVIKSYATDSTCSAVSNSAYAVAKVDVTEGGKATAAVTIKKGWVRKINTALGLRPEELKVQPTADPAGPYPASGSSLYSIQKDGLGVNTATDIEVSTKNYLYQVVGDVLVLVDDIDASGAEYSYIESDEGPSKAGTYLAVNQYVHLLDGEKYTIISKGGYTYGEPKSFDVNTETNTVQVDTDARWNLVTIKVKAQDGDNIMNNLASDLSGKAPKITGIRVLDKEGNVKYALDKEIAPASVEQGSAGSTGTLTALVSGNNIVYNIKAADTDGKLQLLSRGISGGEYKVEVTLKDCKPVTSSATKNLGLEDVTAVTTDKVLAAENKTAIKGVVRLRDEKDENKAERVTNVGKVQIVIYDANGKIAGSGKIDASGEYSITDQISNNKLARLGAGTYTLVARSDSSVVAAETYIDSVTLEATKTLTKDITLTPGGKSQIKATVTNGNLNVINNLSIQAQDQFYKDPTKKGNWAANPASDPNPSDTLLAAGWASGAYGDGGNDVPDYFISNLSAGRYTLVFSQPVAEYVFSNKEVVINELGQSAYVRYEFDPKQEGAGKSRLTVKYPDRATVAPGLPTANGLGRVVVVKRQNGDTEAIAYLGDNITAEASAKEITLGVTTGLTYDVYVYDFGTHYIAQAKDVVVQDIKRTVTVALEDANVD